MRIRRFVAIGLASTVGLFLLGDLLAQMLSTWTTPVDLATINTASAEQ